jgi:SAM-dependent methyltransferase
MQNLDYDKMASTYARHRTANQLVLSELRRKWKSSPESKVLEVGCGTGLYLRALTETIGCKGWGIDPSQEMIRYAVDSEDIHFFKGVAEELPFKASLFDFAFSVNVIHLIKNTHDYFREALRVLKPDCLICTATDSERIIRNRKPLAQYWPGTVEVDLGRYPKIELLRQQMTEAGFVDIEEHEAYRTFEVADAAPYREKAFSCLHLIAEEEFLAGLQRLETDLKTGPVHGMSGFVFLWGYHP